MSEPMWTEPPTPPALDDATVAALADFCEAMARHMARGIVRAAEGGPDGLESICAAVHANLMAARVLRETYDVDVSKYE